MTDAQQPKIEPWDDNKTEPWIVKLSQSIFEWADGYYTRNARSHFGGWELAETIQKAYAAHLASGPASEAPSAATPNENMIEYWLRDYAQFRPNWWPLIEKYLESRASSAPAATPNVRTNEHLERDWMKQNRFLDYRNWLQAEVSRLERKLAELRAVPPAADPGPSCTVCGTEMQFKCPSCGSTPALTPASAAPSETPDPFSKGYKTRPVSDACGDELHAYMNSVGPSQPEGLATK